MKFIRVLEGHEKPAVAEVPCQGGGSSTPSLPFMAESASDGSGAAESDGSGIWERFGADLSA